MSVVAVYAPTEVCETEEKEMFYAKLDSVLDQCPHRDALHCRYLCRRTKIRVFKSLVIPVLLYGCETWTLKRRIDGFGTRCLRRIMVYRWYDFVSNQRLFRETDSRPIASIVRQRQLRHVGMWRDTRKPILLIGLFPLRTIRTGAGKGDAYRTLGCGMLMPAARYGKGACIETR